MNFGVPELKYISKEVRSFDAKQATAFSAMLHRRQSDFCQIIDEVSLDPRCMRAHQFCTMFSALAFAYAEQCSGYRLSNYGRESIQEAAGFIARGEETKMGKRSLRYRERVSRHVLTKDEFDEHDTAWLCTTISAFLFLVEADLEAKHNERSPNNRLHRIANKSGSR